MTSLHFVTTLLSPQSYENRERSIKFKIKTMIKVRVRLDTIGHWLYNKLTRDRKGHSLFQPFRFGVFLSWGSALLLNICKVFHCPLWRCFSAYGCCCWYGVLTVTRRLDFQITYCPGSSLGWLWGRLQGNGGEMQLTEVNSVVDVSHFSKCGWKRLKVI